MDAQGASYVSTFGSILEAIGAVYSGYLNADVAKHNVRVAEAQAKLVEAEAKGQEALNAAGSKIRHIQAEKAMRDLEGEQTAAYAAAGVTMSGTPIDVIVNSRANMELDLALSDINDSIANSSMASQARLSASGYRSESQLYKAQGHSALAQGYGSAAKSLLSAASKSYSMSGSATGKQTIGGTTGSSLYDKVGSNYSIGSRRY